MKKYNITLYLKPLVIIALALSSRGSQANTENRSVLLNPYPENILMLDSKITIAFNTKEGFLGTISTMSEKTGMNLITLLQDRKSEQPASLNFEQKPVYYILDELAKAYRVRWRVVESPAGIGAFILFEDEERMDDKDRLKRLQDAAKGEIEKQGWYLPQGQEDKNKGFSNQYLKGFLEWRNQEFSNIEKQMDVSTLNRLGNGGVPLSRLSNNIRQSLSNLVYNSQRSQNYTALERILSMLLKK